MQLLRSGIPALDDPSEKLRMDIVNYIDQAIGFTIYFKLPVCSGSLLQHFRNIVYRMPAPEMINNVVNKVKQLVDQYTRVDLFFFSKINEPPVDPISPGSPFILVNQRTWIHHEIQI